MEYSKRFKAIYDVMEYSKGFKVIYDVVKYSKRFKAIYDVVKYIQGDLNQSIILLNIQRNLK
ncbi:hypothetical protein VSK93_12925 [Clostridioides difficile]|uniref:hypothetical protein n=1 Tax=Clostridioides difficile TaxID=1496 RepID=UPI0011158259|nr:hypothetical protein [Clostridioides difficile]HBH3656526.1 hypothetical protein [Clostridioides difficile]